MQNNIHINDLYEIVQENKLYDEWFTYYVKDLKLSLLFQKGKIKVWSGKNFIQTIYAPCFDFGVVLVWTVDDFLKLY